MKKLLFCLLVFFLVAPYAWALPVSYNFSGTGAGPQSSGLNAADPDQTITGTFTFDDSLFSGEGAFRITGNPADYIEQEYPDAFIAFTISRSSGDLVSGTELVEQTTARPDLRFMDNDTAEYGVAFNYDNLMPSMYGYINLYFQGVPTVDDPLDLVGATGEATYRTQYQIGGLIYNLFNITVGDQVSIPDASMVFLLGSACLVGFAGARKKFKK